MSNTHPLPEPVRYRLLENGETIKRGDEFSSDDAVSWELSDNIGKPIVYRKHYPTRRALKSYEDAY